MAQEDPGFFPEDNREVVIEKDGKKHRADILIHNTVIEAQHSPISAEEFQDRNEFFEMLGYRIIWIFDMRDRFDSGQIRYLNENDDTKFCWNYPMHIFSVLERKLSDYDGDFALYFDMLPCEDEDSCEIDRVVWSRYDDTEGADLSRFCTNNYNVELKDNIVENFEELFTPETEKRKRNARTAVRKLREDAQTGGFKYAIKYIGEKGHRQVEYTCPRRNAFGLKRFGGTGCSYCRYCYMILNKKEDEDVKSAVYCCYPTAVRELDGTGDEYECCSAPELNY